MIRGVQAGAGGVVLEAHAGAALQSYLRVTSIFGRKMRLRKFKGQIGKILQVKLT